MKWVTYSDDLSYSFTWLCYANNDMYVYAKYLVANYSGVDSTFCDRSTILGGFTEVV